MKTVYRRGLGAALRAHDAGDLRRALQLLLPAAVLGSLRAICAKSRRARCRLRLGALLRPAAQLPAPRLAGAVSVRGVTGRLQVLPASGREHSLPDFTADTAYEPYATSLRMSDIGYRNRNQADLTVSVNSLDEYTRDLSAPSRRRTRPTRARRQGRRRVPAAECQHPADRERVLQLHPPEAGGPLRRAPDQGAAGARASSTWKCGRSMSAPSIRSA